MGECNCQRPMPMDETDQGLGWRCLKCGHDLAHAVLVAIGVAR